MVDQRAAPAFYARDGGWVAEWWTVLHPPYTVWHLSYVVLGAAMAPVVSLTTLAVTLLGFFLAVGVAAHALDELRDRPLRTGIPDSALEAVAVVALAGAAALGVLGVLVRARDDWALAVAIPVGVLLVVAYSLELFGGRLHTDTGFAWAWGGFPVAVGFIAQSPKLTPPVLGAVIVATLAGVATSFAQRRLSTPARELRRRTTSVSGVVGKADGSVEHLDRAALLAPLETTLQALCWAVPLVAVAALLARL